LTAPKEIHRLVAQFEQNLDSYKSGRYNETQLRQEFLDPFFKALGWDMDNTQGHAEAYKDVIHEDAIRIGGAVKAPDYCFRIGGTRKFFLEAKKPSVDIGEEVSAAYQLRRYAWSAKLPLSILSDFEELAVYDCRIKPNKTDSAATARIFYCRFQDYLEKWDWISSIFSKDAVLKGSFDKFAETSKAKRGTAEVDDDILATIESWRNELARNIAMRNSRLSQRELNFAVQRIIDRIIFLRICEDRGIELYGRLLGLTNGPGIYRRLGEVFQDADAKFNSGLFYFSPEKGRHEPPDEITLDLDVDDKILRDLLHGLYYPDSPYEFTVLSADILGQVYEQFLGKVIRLTEGHHAVVEDKPEVKKAGGVYYTPAYIVDYIVRQTVGKLVEGKTPKQAANLRVLDPACGSGSFLINAYQFLLDWHRDWYVANKPEQWAKGRAPALVETTKGWKLTIAARKRILLDNIYGVDIDPQAVEVTKLSLLLKVLEGESEQTIQPYLRLFHERALPDLGNNIKCGNSLIGPDFYQQKELPFLTDDERLRINVFDWDAEFPNIMKAGGFNAVIGNPPYGASFIESEALYFLNNYQVFRGVKDVYTCFIEASLRRLKNKGRFSFIIPSAWLGGPAYEVLRRIILAHQIDTVILLPFDVFKDAYVDTSIIVISNFKPSIKHRVQTRVYKKHEKLNNIALCEKDYRIIDQNFWRKMDGAKFILEPGAVQLLEQISKRCAIIIGDVVDIKRGVLFDKDFLTEKRTSTNSFRYFEGDVYRYKLNLIADYWIEFDDRMKERPKELIWFKGPRILLRRLVNRQQRLMATLTSEALITNKNLYSILPKNKDSVPDILAILGVINSRLISYLYINQVTQATKDDFPQVTIKDILALPFPEITRGINCDQLVKLVNQMIDLHKQLLKVKTPHEKESLQRQIDATDKHIDQLVYELYGLTEDEIKIVEEAN
jgi:type I restriction-modification system DNA methylase subunit